MTEEKRQASSHFDWAKVRAQAREMVRAQRNTYASNRLEQSGTYAGNSEIVVDGRRYPFRDTQGINPQPGDRLTVRNVGRKAVVIMAPSEGTEVR